MLTEQYRQTLNGIGSHNSVGYIPLTPEMLLPIGPAHGLAA